MFIVCEAKKNYVKCGFSNYFYFYMIDIQLNLFSHNYLIIDLGPVVSKAFSLNGG